MSKVNSLKRRLSGVLIIGALVVLTINAQTLQPAPAPPSPQEQKKMPALPPIDQQTVSPDRPGGGAQLPSQEVRLSSSQFIDPTGLTVDNLLQDGFRRRADIFAARQRLGIAEGRLVQAGLRPNPTVDSDYSSAKFLGGQNEGEMSFGISQVFETAGKRRKRVKVARLELAQVKAEVLALERQFAADLRAAYARALAAGRQLDTFEQLIAGSNELVRITNERLKQGDVAPLELNIVKVETDRLRTQAVKARAALESEIISLHTLVALDQKEPLRIAPLPERPPRLDLSLIEATEMAMGERADLQAARLGEQAGLARISLARAQGVPDFALNSKVSITRDIFDDTPFGPIKDRDKILSFGVSVGLPVFNRNQGEIAVATAERVQAQRQREFLESTIQRDVALAYRQYRAAAETLVIFATQIIPNAEKNLQTVRAAYNAGEFSIFDVVAEQRRLIENETGYNEALASYYSALAELERALGTMIPASAFAPGLVSVVPDLKTMELSRTAIRRSVASALLKVGQQASNGSTLVIDGAAAFEPVSVPTTEVPTETQPLRTTKP